MDRKEDRYTYRVTWSEDDQEYVGLCAEFSQFKLAGPHPRSRLKGNTSGRGGRGQ